MKTIKYITTFILLLGMLLFNSEYLFVYAFNYASNTVYASLELNTYNSFETKIERLEKIVQSNHINVFTTDINFEQYNAKMIIYTNADNGSIYNFLKIQPMNHKSIFYGNIEIEIHSIEEIPPRNKLNVMVLDDSSKYPIFIDELQQVFEISNNKRGIDNNAASFLKPIYAMWFVFLALILFLSLFDIDCKKKSIFIKRIYGESTLKIIFSEIFTDLLINIIIVFVATTVIKQISTISISSVYIYLISLLVVSAMPYLLLIRFDRSVFLHNNASLKKTISFGYIYKTVLIVITIIVSSYSLIQINSLSKIINNYKLIEGFSDYYLCSVTPDDKELEKVDNKAEMLINVRTRTEEIYRKYYHSQNAIIINKLADDNTIYCNKNAEPYVLNLFGDYIDNNLKADVLCFYPNITNKDMISFQEDIKNTILHIDGASWNPVINYIPYSKEINAVYFTDEDMMINSITNPCVILCNRTPDEIKSKIDECQKSFASILYNDIAEIKDYIDSIPEISGTIRSIKEFYQTQHTKHIRIISFFLFISISFFILNIVVCFFIIKMEYRLHAKEYCIKKTLGYSFISKFFSMIRTYLLTSIIGGMSSIIIFKSDLFIISTICLGVFITDCVAAFYLSLKIENNNIIKCLNGGTV